MKHIENDNLIEYHLKKLSKSEERIVQHHLEECQVCQRNLSLLGELEVAWQEELTVIRDEDIHSSVDNIMFQLEWEQSPQPWRNNFNKRKSFLHVSVSAAATIIFIQQGIFLEISNFSNLMVHLFLDAPVHFQDITGRGITLFEVNVMEYLTRNR